ncbi:MAG: TonB-dependent receptor plug domain-containing protein [Bacteroidota bacterium]
MQHTKNTFLTIGMALCAATATAQSADTARPLLYKEQTLQPVEVRSLRAGSDAPFAKTDISGKDLEKQNLGEDLPMLLQYTPSAVTTPYPCARVGYTGLRIRGVDASRINVTLNGIPVNDPEEQGTYFVDLPDMASAASSIQLQRGVGTSTNGAGAFGATMSISNINQMDSAGAIMNSSYGSFNTKKNTLMAGTGMLKGGWQFDVRLSQINSDGYIQRSASDLRSMQFTAGWTPNDKTSLHLMVMTGTEKTGQAWDGVSQDSLKTNRTFNELGLKSDGTYYKNQTDNYQQDYYQLFADHKFSPYITGHIGIFLTKGRGYYEEYKMNQAYADYGLSGVPYGAGTKDTTDLIRQLWLDNYYYGAVFSLMYEKNQTQLTLGGGLTQFENQHYGYVNWAQFGGVPDNYKWYQNDAQKNDFNIYLKAQHKFGDKLIAYADVQYRSIAYFINGFDDNASLRPNVNYSFFNPKAGLTYLLRNTSAQRQRIYASIAVANREPNRADFEAAQLTLPKPESLYDAEAGYEISKKKWNFGANLYYMSYKDQLVLTGQINSVGEYTQTNVASSYRAGIELQAAVKPTDWLKIHGNYTYSVNKINDYTQYLDEYDAQGTYLGQQSFKLGTTDIAFAPNHVGAATVSFMPIRNASHGQSLSIDLIEKFVGQQFLDNTGNSTRILEAYSFCNLLIRYSVKVRPFKELSATLALQNIFDQAYSNNGAAYPYYSVGQVVNINYLFPQAGFHCMAGLSLKW